MVPAQDVDSELQQMFSNSPGLSTSQNSGRDTQIVESQGGLSQISLGVTVLRAHNIPYIKRLFVRKRRFYVTVTHLVTTKNVTTKKTESVHFDGENVQWNQWLGVFSTQQSSHLTLRLYEKRLTHRDVLIGIRDIPIPVTSQNVPFVLSNGDGGQSTLPVTLYLAIDVSANVSTQISANEPIKRDDTPTEDVTKPPISPDSGGSIQSPEPFLPPSGHIAIGISVPTTSHSQAEISLAGDSVLALHRAGEAFEPIDRSSKTWEMVVGRIKWVTDTLSSIAELSPYAKMACGLLLAIPKTLLEQYQRDDNVRTLLEAMRDAFDFAHHEETLRSIKPESRQAQILTLMLHDVCSCGDFIQSYANDPQFWKRTLKNMDGGVAKNIEDLSAALAKHRRAFFDHVAITTEITAFQILDGVGMLSAKVDGISTRLEWLSDHVSDAELDRKIGEIPYGTGSRFIPDKSCLAGTRVDFLDFIVNWVNDPDSERCLVLFGQAGTGKSSIAHEIARRFDNMHRLTSSFIFLRKEQSKREAYHLFTTLARDLADRYPSFKVALGKVVKGSSSLRIGTCDYGTLFKSLILEPLKDLHIVGPILVVIDALDESGDVTGENGLHTFLSKALSKLPPNFRVLITSRPEHDIESAFVGASVGDKSANIKIKYANDPELAATTREDILAFLKEKLPSDEFKNHGEALAIRAEGLFQWAAVAREYILDPPEHFGFDKTKCIEHLLRLTADRHRRDPLDELYKEVLEKYFTQQGSRLLFKSAVGQLVTSIEPLTIRSLTTLRRHAGAGDGDAVVRLLRRLSSLLSNVNSSDENLPIIPLHTSFRDFLTNEEKSGDFCVRPQDAHYLLAHSSLSLLLSGLKFNICNLESSYLANKDIEDLVSRVDKYVPPALSYACRFWDGHLEHIDFDTNLLGKLRTFFEKNFLFWLEVLSLTSDVGLASVACSALNLWLAKGLAPGQGVSRIELEKFRSFVNDASVYVRYFGKAMAKSAPHIYLSALPFAPTRSRVSAHYSSLFPRVLRVERGRLTHWPSSELVISNVGAVVNSIALSPDGKRIVSGSRDQTIRMWNATTGEKVTSPFTGHSSSVESVAFSPDGQRIVSGSDDGKICVWNATTGETEAGPFTGHTSGIRSVAFSRDGQRIASGSRDKTIRMWNAATGETEADPFSGHDDWVGSVAFSPDGRWVVSGSDDGTIRMWNATKGETEARLLTGHTDSVNSVVFSPDGQRIISVSDDGTIRVWNATTGKTEASPLTGHRTSIKSVAFSPDGQRIVSGSDDGIIRVWNTTTGEPEARPFTGHTSPVKYVAFSPDGQCIVSGSDDEIRVWSATTAAMEPGPFSGHTDLVRSVAFSPDGQWIVSGSDDQTIRVWNAATGETEAGPFIGHGSSVDSVAFSPDGQRIVSGSDDETIRVWDTATGDTKAGPFIGHKFPVESVAFSPDGRRIVSGSDDRTIRVWNATTGETEAGPFTGHTSSVESVAFSPDGQRIVSGSDDGTIRVWNAITGDTEAGPFTGHTDWVWSVAFSPDGQRIVSSSYDGTIRVWNATTGDTEAGPSSFTGHKSSVDSVAFSPDGQRIVSGSDDGTIRVWNASTGETVAGPFAGHTSSVESVAFSPDGQRVVSGSDDQTIRVWSVTTGATTASPFFEHTSSVESVAFLPGGNTGTARHVDFTDQSVIDEEGWICGSKGQLLMWIPQPHRAHLHRPSNIWVSGGFETRIDLSTFVHGRDWDTCIKT